MQFTGEPILLDQHPGIFKGDIADQKQSCQGEQRRQ